MVELVYKFDEKSYRECCESIAKVTIQKFFGPQTHTHIYIYIAIRTPIYRSLYPARLRTQVIKEGCKKVR